MRRESQHWGTATALPCSSNFFWEVFSRPAEVLPTSPVKYKPDEVLPLSFLPDEISSKPDEISSG